MPIPRSSIRPTAADLAGSPARELFVRVLRSWASDLLNLRRSGLEQPSFRRGAWCRAGRIEGPTPRQAEAA